VVLCRPFLLLLTVLLSAGQAGADMTVVPFPATLKYRPMRGGRSKIPLVRTKLEVPLMGLTLQVQEPESYRRFVQADLLAVSSDGKKFAVAFIGVEPPDAYKKNLYAIGDAWVAHVTVAGVPASIAFVGLNTKQISAFVQSLEARPSSTAGLFSIVPDAMAETVAVTRPEENPALSDKLLNGTAEAFAGCGLDFLDSGWDISLIRPTYNLGRSLYYFRSSIAKSVADVKWLLHAALDFNNSVVKVFKGFWNMPIGQRSALVCRVGEMVMGTYTAALKAGNLPLARTEMTGAIRKASAGLAKEPEAPLKVAIVTAADLNPKTVPGYITQGEKAMDDLVKLGQSLRDRHIDPRGTNIPEFASQIPDDIQFARGAIMEQGVDMDRMEILKQFEKEANDRVKTGKVTYEWWHDFNFRLSMLMTPAAKRTAVAGGENVPFVQDLLKDGSWKTEDGFRATAARQHTFGGGLNGHDVAKSFPDRIILPTREGEVGIGALNEMYGSDVDPAGMTQNKLRADGREMWPDHFNRHDHVHAENEDFEVSYLELSPSEMHTLRNNYLQYREQVPVEQRPQFEFGYFVATHELPMADDLIRNGGTHLAQRSDLPPALMDPDWYAGTVPKWASQSTANALKFLQMADEAMKQFAAKSYPRTPAAK
jgi:hypothetical protein